MKYLSLFNSSGSSSGGPNGVRSRGPGPNNVRAMPTFRQRVANAAGAGARALIAAPRGTGVMGRLRQAGAAGLRGFDRGVRGR